jgi:hypothetical protein
MYHSEHIVDYYNEKLHTCNKKDYAHWFKLLNRAYEEDFAQYDGGPYN